MSRAVRFEQFGPVDVLQVVEVDPPGAEPGEVLVEVVAAAVNPGEIAIREGRMEEIYPTALPCGQGSDFAGRVAGLGAGVAGWTVGQEVIGWTERRAAQADFVTVPADHLVAKPPEVDWDQAGALYVAGATAYAAVRAVELRAGETVVVSGAAGGVGSLVVQLARSRGARVVGIAGAHNAAWLESLGAVPVQYTDDLVAQLVPAAPNGVDAFIDTFGDGYLELAKRLGVSPARIDTIIDFRAAQEMGAKAEGSAAASSARVLAELAGMIAAGELRIPIARTYPLEQVREAYAVLAERHTRGKIVLRLR